MAITGPIIAQAELPDMKLPPMTLKPCSAQSAPAMISTTPPRPRSQFRTV
jgi:hypothetical protein